MQPPMQMRTYTIQNTQSIHTHAHATAPNFIMCEHVGAICPLCGDALKVAVRWLSGAQKIHARHGTDRQIVLSLEMFETDVQGVLDEYLRGLIRESDFVADARSPLSFSYSGAKARELHGVT